MKEDKRGGRKPAPVPTGHDQRAAARDHSVPHGNRKNDAIPPVSYTHLTLPTICSV